MLETQLQDRDYLLKRGFSAADISLGYTLFFAKSCIGTELTELVSDYFKRIMSRPAAQTTMSDLNKT